METEKTFYVSLYGGRSISRDDEADQWFMESAGVSREISVAEVIRLVEDNAKKYKLVGGAAFDMRLRRSLTESVSKQRPNGR